ncbi:MAG TPA: transcriptional regulator [Firmicutes bacterium]|jgi:predicted NBD/HSP70 family sugar kinase|nr:transcriptional regulator [Bacillota bacterium]
MEKKIVAIHPRLVPVLDRKFRPAILEYRAFLKAVADSNQAVPFRIALERSNGWISVYETSIFADNSELAESNYFYVERLVKTLLWQKGGWRIICGGSPKVGKYLQKIYAPGGLRDFDIRFMSRVYERPFVVEITDYDRVPAANETSQPIGRNLEGCRIGFDAGGSDRKVSAVIDGKAVYSEEVVWFPKVQTNPDYHYQEILTAIQKASAMMPRVDAIGVSAAGIYINNRVMAASLFMKVPEDMFEKKVKDIFLRIQKVMGEVPMEVVNDGDVTALAGAIDLNETRILGISMGTSEAGGYIDNQGNITGWLNELAFIPVDFNPEATIDEWSGDYGCGVKYFSQDAVIKLATVVGIDFMELLSPAEKLKLLQELLIDGDLRVKQIFETLGVYLGYGLAYYAEFYDIGHVLILGRVTSGEGGNLILKSANEVLTVEFPELAAKLTLHLPDESSRRVGQAIAAASLPNIKC